MEVDNQPHYNRLAIEPKDVCKANMSVVAYRGAMKWNIEKYLWRNKGSNIEDTKKLIVYAKWLLESYEGDKNVNS